jgi:hypothetical protein
MVASGKGRQGQSSVRRDSRTATLEFARELLGNAIGQGISEHQHVRVPIVVGLYVAGPVSLEPGDDLIGREGQMLPEHRSGRLLGPMRIGTTEESCNLLTIRLPFLLGGCELFSISAFAAETTSTAIKLWSRNSSVSFFPAASPL